MNKKHLEKIILTSIALTGLLFALGFGISFANAAPYGDYFSNSDSVAFSDWVGEEGTLQVCDSYQAIFASNSCITGASLSNQAGQLAAVVSAFTAGSTEFSGDDSQSPDLSVNEQSCNAGGGNLQIAAQNGLDSYRFDNVTDSENIVINDDGINPGSLSFRNLPSATYRFRGSLNNQTETLNLAIDCREEPAPRIALDRNSCVAEDGRAIVALYNVGDFILTDFETGVIVDNGNLSGINTKMFAGLPDTTYYLSVNDGADTLTFVVGCDPSEEEPADLSIQCSVAPNEVTVGELSLWQAEASGASGAYTYQWTGDVSGDEASIETRYSESGEKTGYITVSAGEKERTARCELTVTEDSTDDDGSAAMRTLRTIEEF